MRSAEASFASSKDPQAIRATISAAHGCEPEVRRLVLEARLYRLRGIAQAVEHGFACAIGIPYAEQSEVEALFWSEFALSDASERTCSEPET